MAKPNGYVIWEGASLYDGTPLVVIVTGTAGKASANRKTGAILQTWILRADMEPTAALKAGADTAICGTCPHRSKASGGSGGCYVNVGQAPLGVWRAWKRGVYPAASTAAERASIGNRKPVRLGSYGDPAAVPVEVWRALTFGATFTTGYTHGWRTSDPALAGLCMASADSLADARHARERGFRTFRVAPFGDDYREHGEARCPASEEAGKRVTCEGCPLARSVDGRKVPGCGGANVVGPNVVIQAHGASKRRVNV
jgi:hypothetical protein